MRRGVCVHRRRTDVFCRQRLQERTKALQKLQSKTGRGRRRRGRTRVANARGNEDKLLAMWEGNDSSLPADAGTTGLLPRMLPATPGHGSGIEGSGFMLRGQVRKVPAEHVSDGTDILVCPFLFGTRCVAACRPRACNFRHAAV